MIRLLLFSGLAVAYIGSARVAQAVPPNGVVASHVGANDPTTEGWVLGVTAGTFSIGPVDADFGYIPAWNLETISSNADVTYRFGLTDEQVDAILTDGWSLTVALRVLSAADGGLAVCRT